MTIEIEITLLSNMVNLAICTDQQRRAFIAGFNGDPLPPYARYQMQEKHRLGQTVLRILYPYLAQSRDRS